MPQYIEIHITTPTEAEALRIGARAVEERLAACAQISGPVQSIYVWKGQTENSLESILCLKSEHSLFERLVEFIRKEHSYECPQIIAVPILAVSEDYAEWMKQNLSL